MKKTKWLLGVFITGSLLLLAGCGTQKATGNEVNTKTETPADAIYPVLVDEHRKTKASEIKLTDFSITLPEGYVYGKDEQEDYTAYYVWRDEPDKKYTTKSDGDIMFYIYDGVDKNSLHEEITDNEARGSFTNTYISYLRDAVQGKFNVDPTLTYSADDKYFVCCLDGNSGDYLTTTYSAMCYPKTYYGIYTLQKNTTTFSRQFYGFIFSNNEDGDIFSEEEYNSLMDDIKTQFDITEFYSTPQIATNYDTSKDISAGRSYNQMLTLFENTYLYYGEKTGKLNEAYEKKATETPTPTNQEDAESSSPEPTESPATTALPEQEEETQEENTETE